MSPMSQARRERIAVPWMLDGAKLPRSNPGFATLRPKASRVFDQMTEEMGKAEWGVGNDTGIARSELRAHFLVR
jgi:hypothetical protein